MKKFPFIFFLAVLFSNHIQAKKVSGYIIEVNNDTTKVIFDIPLDSPFGGDPDLERLQWKVKYYDSTKVKKILIPKMVKGIVFTFERRTIKMITCFDNLGVVDGKSSYQREFFFHVISEEKIITLRAYRTLLLEGINGGKGMASFGDFPYVYRKNNGELFFDKTPDVAKYFTDCPDIMKKINNKEYQNDYIAQIVNDYNKVCGK
ncbi:MAG: hypothetical protein K0S32_3265 [Bacteroidetes bacterium]|jgi:hypothetical protein|nr:hypothetical protein [Bacteroidota bacterium]